MIYCIKQLSCSSAGDVGSETIITPLPYLHSASSCRALRALSKAVVSMASSCSICLSTGAGSSSSIPATQTGVLTMLKDVIRLPHRCPYLWVSQHHPRVCCRWHCTAVHPEHPGLLLPPCSRLTHQSAAFTWRCNVMIIAFPDDCHLWQLSFSFTSSNHVNISAEYFLQK